jgi:Ca2+-binding RTX toxin-like protein
MATQVITEDKDIAGLAVDLGTTDDAFVALGISVINTLAVDAYSIAIEGWGNGHSVDILGTVLSYGMAINLGASAVDNFNEYLHVGETGYIRSTADQGVVFLGSQSTIDNDGQIYGETNGIGWWSAAAEPAGLRSYIFNSGHIDGVNDGIYLNTTEAITIRNSGIVSGGAYAIAVTGNGPIRLVNHGLLDGIVALGEGNDVYKGTEGEANSNIQGFGGNDRLLGGDGIEIFFGGEGKDVISAGEGDDFLGGEGGADRLTGGDGADEFIYFVASESPAKTAADLITDFSSADSDLIALADMDAKAASAKNDAFKFIGSDDFSGKAGELRYEIVGSSTYVYGNLDTDAATEFVLQLSGKLKLVATDFDL